MFWYEWMKRNRLLVSSTEQSSIKAAGGCSRTCQWDSWFAAMMAWDRAFILKDMQCDSSPCCSTRGITDLWFDLKGSESKKYGDCDILSLVFSISSLSFSAGLKAEANKMTFRTFFHIEYPTGSKDSSTPRQHTGLCTSVVIILIPLFLQ